jgi:iron complex transport system substrate-binding protein
MALIRYSFVLIVFCLMISCVYRQDKPLNSVGISDTVMNKYANGYKIIKHSNYTEISVYNPWQKSGNVKLDYLLIKNEKDTLERSVTGCKIKLPVRKAICLSTTHLAFIDALDELGTVKAISGKNLVNNHKIRAGIEKGYIIDVGFERSLNYEAISAIKPDVVFAYGVESDISGYINKFKELGIPVVMVGEYLETHPLAKFEWIKFFGEFYGKQEIANLLFDSISNKYISLKNSISSLKLKPSVISALPWNGTWYISGNKTYLATLIADAGGDYVWKDLDSRESKPIDFELVYTRSENADVWINPGAATDLQFISNIDKRLTRLKPFKTGYIFNNNERINKTGGNDYWESGTVQPHVILEDLIKILHPQQNENHALFYYKKLN